MNTDKNSDILIKVEKLRKSFGEHEVLKGINAEIRKGDVLVVVGASGSGKSTFLRCLNLLEEPTDGRIFFEGVDITEKSVDINLAEYDNSPNKITQTGQADRRRKCKKTFRESRFTRPCTGISLTAFRRTETKNSYCESFVYES